MGITLKFPIADSAWHLTSILRRLEALISAGSGYPAAIADDLRGPTRPDPGRRAGQLSTTNGHLGR
jgi:hypothetical protein